MKKKHLLFVCSSNLDRSPAAESLFENSLNYEAKSAGLYPHAEIVLSKKLIDWSDIIFVMNETKENHKTLLLENFPEAENKEIIVLGISNDYCRNDPELKRRLIITLKRYSFL